MSLSSVRNNKNNEFNNVWIGNFFFNILIYKSVNYDRKFRKFKKHNEWHMRKYMCEFTVYSFLQIPEGKKCLKKKVTGGNRLSSLPYTTTGRTAAPVFFFHGVDDDNSNNIVNFFIFFYSITRPWRQRRTIFLLYI